MDDGREDGDVVIIANQQEQRGGDTLGVSGVLVV